MLDLNLAIIEDDEILLNRLYKILSREVKLVSTYSSSKSFLDDLDKGIIPNVILSDINMSSINGLEMIAILREKNIKIPVILASAFSEPEYFIEAINLRVRRFLVKPIDIDILLDELKHIDEELKLKSELETKDNLLLIQSKMAAMGEMLANIAHQWKQPLNTISISASSIQLAKELETDINEEELKDLIENIINSVKYMNETISDFQNYFKPNKLEKCFYLEDTIKKVEKLLLPQCKTHNIELIKYIENVTLCSFENELIQVLINLIKNSVEQLSNISEDRFIIINIFSQDENTIIEVKDNGGGIPSTIIDKVFDSYFTTKGDNGTGIGLYLSKEIVEKHLNGHIKVENSNFLYDNKEYCGACFTLTLKSLEF
ncbi:MAG: sensor histidine kinase [Halarcobacter sp.]